MKTKLFFLVILLSFSFSNAQIVNIPDANFKAKLIMLGVDTNSDGNIQVSEANARTSLDLYGANISSLAGITSFTNLQQLRCRSNQLSTLDVSGMNSLTYLECSFNQLNNLNLGGLTNLQTLHCNSNQLTTLNLSGLSNLILLDCFDNQLTSLNPIDSTNLQVLSCSANQLTSLNIDGLTFLTRLTCYNNNLTTLNLNGLIALESLECFLNDLTSLDLSTNLQLNTVRCNNNDLTSIVFSNSFYPNFQTLFCSDNLFSSLDLSNMPLTAFSGNNNPLLTSINLKNGSNLTGVVFANCPTLNYICADEEEINLLNSRIMTYGYTNCHVNSYCTFQPGGTFYTISGTNRFDSNANGCDVSDIIVPNLKLSFTSETTTGNLIPDLSGNYQYEVQAGTHSIVPILESPTYYSVSPVIASVTFPTASNPFTQNFCLTSTGSHNDLEIVMIPIQDARPGFDANYKIIFKNKGTNPQSGLITLNYNDSILDYVSSIPAFANQNVNSFTWNFTNLLPFEIRTILITLNLNGTTENPAINDGDILTYVATIEGLSDETPTDNSSTFNQTVVNSFDPNDKICLEGTSITPATVGEYVHYIVRFENTGTANAINVVIKDIIDTAKYEISTLIPQSGSHPFTTRFINSNQVEFIFQNINLPFDDANNDGYVAFKIKTKPTLVVGETFSNSANIYFDYNFPIITNNYTTTVQTLGLNEILISNISVYPNPVKDLVNFNTQEKIIKIEISDIAGRILSSNLVNENKLDLNGLRTGNYILKIYTEKGITNTKIIKD